MKRLVELLNDKNCEQTSVKELARIVGIHPVTLSRQFPKYFNTTLGEYIRKIRVNKSISLIIGNTKSLTQIAQESGFADQAHFNKMFKRYIGTTPGEYKKLYCKR